MTLIHVDSPASTSEVTYDLAIGYSNDSGWLYSSVVPPGWSNPDSKYTTHISV